MRRAKSSTAPPGAGVSAPIFIPAPIGGLNTRDPPSTVPPNEAVMMSGMFPTNTGVMKRKGILNHATGLPTVVRSLMVYTANNGTEAMFAASNTAFYNVTAAGAVGAAVQSGLANATWQHVNFTNSAGSAFLCCFNGVDSPRYWDGATWTTITGASTPAITGLTTSTIISGAVHQRRMWLVQVDSLKAWYLPIDSVGGAAQAIDLGGIAYKGGYIMAMESWTVDGGDGMDDYLVCITSEGQLVAFAGTDPSSASTWQLVGVWDIAEPIGRRCLYAYKGDVLIITTGGVASAARVMSGDTSTSGMLTDKISGTYQAQVASNASVFGWQLMYYPKAEMLMLSTSGSGETYAMNTVTGAWSGELGSAAQSYCWALLNGDPYFGPVSVSTIVKKFWTGQHDEGVASITGYVLGGFSDFGSGQIKQAKLCRAAIKTNGAAQILSQARADFNNDIAFPATSALNGTTGFSPWENCTRAVGSYLSLYFATFSTAEVIYSGGYIVFEVGSIVGTSIKV